MDRIVREMDMPVDNGFQEIYINASADDGAAEKEHSMIISMLKNKISMEQIISITGLTMEKITSIGKQAAVL